MTTGYRFEGRVQVAFAAAVADLPLHDFTIVVRPDKARASVTVVPHGPSGVGEPDYGAAFEFSLDITDDAEAAAAAAAKAVRVRME